METEHFFTCPHCWQKISMILDLSIEEQSYVEDCEVCCNPIQINYTAEDGEINDFWAESIEQ
jgi:transcription elongation factor Elf1